MKRKQTIIEQATLPISKALSIPSWSSQRNLVILKWHRTWAPGGGSLTPSWQPYTNPKPLSWNCSELIYWNHRNHRLVWLGRDPEGSSSLTLKFCCTCHTNMCIYCPFCLFYPHFCPYSALKKGRKYIENTQLFLWKVCFSLAQNAAKFCSQTSPFSQG